MLRFQKVDLRYQTIWKQPLAHPFHEQLTARYLRFFPSPPPTAPFASETWSRVPFFFLPAANPLKPPIPVSALGLSQIFNSTRILPTRNYVNAGPFQKNSNLTAFCSRVLVLIDLEMTMPRLWIRAPFACEALLSLSRSVRPSVRPLARESENVRSSRRPFMPDLISSPIKLGRPYLPP